MLATTSPHDLVDPLATALGFDDVIATRYQEVDGDYTGRLVGRFVWGTGKRDAVAGVGGRPTTSTWPTATPTRTASSTSRSSARSGTPTRSTPTPAWPAVALARRWPLEHWDRPPGVPSVVGLEPYHLLRPFVRPESFPYARFTVNGIEHVPARGPGHPGLQPPQLLRRGRPRPGGRPARPPGAVHGQTGAVRRPGGRPAGPGPRGHPGRPRQRLRATRCSRATAALRAGEAVIVLPQGTIPRGEAFFDPVLHGKTGAARLAAATGAPVVPIGLWGTEKVWPRSAKVPNVTTLQHPPRVTVTVGPPVRAGADRRGGRHRDVDGRRGRTCCPTRPAEAHVPTDEELAATRPSA